ncbi:pyruvate-ferredoxin/flavodoxin oxidoreductase [Fluviicoccus keumensis]|uniref:Pyruvate-flavodoxin oxidoreductase n=1 Tax=Fluviicoccus keumensis TaxID=1435465 RepID=A0A4Q7Z8D2_9GAMM|nr:pyruvate:ferredoxin (flavodoxin) oxidoreductase [Fluviicoccus keumensis]RZU46767.1 pyruvate-ferredoxin/flavodoxin oxidoreductase [Fluviicoccus keumensis]
MTTGRHATLDANEVVASVAYRLSEAIAIYPITPASAMGEHADDWAAGQRPNLWGQAPSVIEMQSEGGAAGAVHGALQAGALTTTFTASQGLLLMMPNLYKIAGELTAFCLHVAARSVATHALSIFGDHSDVMAMRPTGFALLASGSPQEAQDLAAIAHAATLESRIPFLHFFDGFRTSHELQKIRTLADEDLRALIDPAAVRAHRERALTPDRPVLRGTAQNPDAFFQAREAAEPWYRACPETVSTVMERFAGITGRQYRLFDYHGHPEAERVLVLMGSGAETAHETADWLLARGEKVGVLRVRLYRPFSVRHFLDALPASVTALAVLDRTKEPGATGDPLYLDVVAALMDGLAAGDLPFAGLPKVIGGRYGLSSKEFTPGMAKAVFDELARPAPRRRFTIGIRDDISHSSLDYDETLDIESPDVTRAVFYGLGADGTVSSNKASIKLIGDQTELYCQGHFVYDSKKSGSTTVSHLRFGPKPIRSTYEIRHAPFIAVHDAGFLDKYDVLERAADGATLLLNTPAPAETVWTTLPQEIQRGLIAKGCRLFVIDASRIAADAGLGNRINTVMQVCFFALAKVLPLDQALAGIKQSVTEVWGKRGSEVIRRNHAAIDGALAGLHEVSLPSIADSTRQRRAMVTADADAFAQRVTRLLLEGYGDRLPVSAFTPDGTWPTATSKLEKRDIAHEIPVWEPDVCVQCNRCSTICPHSAIRTVVFEPETAANAPDAFRHVPETATPELKGLAYTVQVAPDDCTGCGLCVDECPAKDRKQLKRKAINMRPVAEHREREREAWAFLTTVPPIERTRIPRDAKSLALLPPLFEFSGACAGCGETPYIRLLTQLFGDRLLIANATGCSSIYGGNLPTTPYTRDAHGRGPAWNNSLFEDNAEFGFGLRLGVDRLHDHARQLLDALAPQLPENLLAALSARTDTTNESDMAAARDAVSRLQAQLTGLTSPEAAELQQLADYLVPKSVWTIGGDGWAYDIGYGGLDHVLASNRKANILVLDTEVYSNTGGQQSKATPLGAVAKFASAGKETRKKDLGLLAMSYGHVYVASVAMQSRSHQTVKAFLEAEAHPGPSLIIAHSPCIAHGYDLLHSPAQQKRAVDSGAWPLYRFDPKRIDAGLPPLQLDAHDDRIPMQQYMEQEARFRMVELRDPERYRTLVQAAEHATAERRALYHQLAGIRIPVTEVPHD